MSIFKESFKPNIAAQLKKRQEIMTLRNPQELHYLNSRNSWIRMSSSVDVLKSTITNPTIDQLKDPANYDNSLAKKYILLGGTLSENGTLKSGIGANFSNAYSRQSAEGIDYRLGIRPMPGINKIEVKSLGAYGSLREVTVSFQCWDIHQLEDLELLYMRPGYTVLVEWGWSPYFDENGKYSTTVDFYDIVNIKKTKETIWKELDEKMAKNGNYEAMFGYIKNYSWDARMDGGYDCTINVISLGEVIESLKVNYIPSSVIPSIKKSGYLLPNIKSDVAVSISDLVVDTVESAYSQNILAGLFYELYTIGLKQDPGTEDAGKSYFLTDTKYGSQYNLFRKTININGEDVSDDKKIGESDEQVYVTLDSLCDIINNYVLLKDKESAKPFLNITTRDLSFTGSINNTTGDGYLLALAHPLQTSVDPRVCLIKNMLWVNGININLTTSGSASESSGDPVITFPHNLKPIPYASTPEEFVKTLIRNTVPVTKINGKDAVKEFIKNYIQGPSGSRYSDDQIKENVREVTRVFNELYSTYKIEKPTLSKTFDLDFDETSSDGLRVGKTLKEVLPSTNTFKDLLDDAAAANLGSDRYEDALGGSDNTDVADGDPVADEKEKIEEKKEELKELEESAKEGSKFLENISLPYYVNNDYNTELGIIGNIYINIKMLYDLSIDANVEAQDKKEKKEIALYDFIKNVLSKISPVIGNVNTFDISVDEKNNARIIDVNYVDKSAMENPKNVYDNAFELQVHNLNSIVRSYKLESKIFPEQSSIIAIGAQVEGGALGVDTTTFVAFNKSIRDRIIPVKNAPSDDLTTYNDAKEKLDALLSNLELLYKFFGRLKPGLITDANFDVDKAGDYQNALKDLINYIRSILTSKTNNKAILPTILSIEMDGIGGIVIGSLFKINTDILPKGYKGSGQGGIGPNVGYLVTKLGHTVDKGDWVTKIDAQTIILDAPQSSVESFDYSNISINVNPTTEKEVIATTSTPATTTAATAVPNSSASNNVKAMIRATNSVFAAGAKSGLCAQYTYSIAKDYIAAIRNQPLKGRVTGVAGNAGTAGYRKVLTNLGYSMTYVGNISRTALVKLINETKWNIGDIINYRSTTKPKPNLAGEFNNCPKNSPNNCFCYGHTQIYTDGVQANGKGVKWTSSVPDNYGSDKNSVVVYRWEGPWEVYVFRSPV